MARKSTAFPPREPGKRFVCHRRTTKLIAPHNARGFRSIMGNSDEDVITAYDSDATIRPKISKDSGELTFMLLPVVPADHEHIRPVHFISTCSISQRELEARVMSPG